MFGFLSRLSKKTEEESLDERLVNLYKGLLDKKIYGEKLINAGMLSYSTDRDNSGYYNSSKYIENYVKQRCGYDYYEANCAGEDVKHSAMREIDSLRLVIGQLGYNEADILERAYALIERVGWNPECIDKDFGKEIKKLRKCG